MIRALSRHLSLNGSKCWPFPRGSFVSDTFIIYALKIIRQKCILKLEGLPVSFFFFFFLVWFVLCFQPILETFSFSEAQTCQAIKIHISIFSAFIWACVCQSLPWKNGYRTNEYIVDCPDLTESLFPRVIPPTHT